MVRKPATGRFLSTLSLRRATFTSVTSSAGTTDFYPRSPCGERLGLSYFYIIKITISIHALLAESDKALVILPKQFNNFYPRSPCGERQLARAGFFFCLFISIHALLAESDSFFKRLFGIHEEFLSTLSLRRATLIIREYVSKT